MQKKDLGTVKYSPDKSGKSKVTTVNFKFKSGGVIHIACYDMKDASLGASGFNVSMGTQEYYIWNLTEAF